MKRRISCNTIGILLQPLKRLHQNDKTGQEMNTDFTPLIVSRALHLYSRALQYPYIELTYEFQNILREIEKNISNDFDNTVAALILDLINSFQGEEMGALQGEFTRLFTPVEDDDPLISLHLSSVNRQAGSDELYELISESPFFLDGDDQYDSLPLVLDYFSVIISEDLDQAEDFFDKYINSNVPRLNEIIYKGSNLSFYKEAARGLNELVYLLAG